MINLGFAPGMRQPRGLGGVLEILTIMEMLTGGGDMLDRVLKGAAGQGMGRDYAAEGDIPPPGRSPAGDIGFGPTRPSMRRPWGDIGAGGLEQSLMQMLLGLFGGYYM